MAQSENTCGACALSNPDAPRLPIITLLTLLSHNAFCCSCWDNYRTKYDLVRNIIESFFKLNPEAIVIWSFSSLGVVRYSGTKYGNRSKFSVIQILKKLLTLNSINTNAMLYEEPQCLRNWKREDHFRENYPTFTVKKTLMFCKEMIAEEREKLIARRDCLRIAYKEKHPLIIMLPPEIWNLIFEYL